MWIIFWNGVQLFRYVKFLIQLGQFSSCMITSYVIFYTCILFYNLHILVHVCPYLIQIKQPYINVYKSRIAVSYIVYISYFRLVCITDCMCYWLYVRSCVYVDWAEAWWLYGNGTEGAFQGHRAHLVREIGFPRPQHCHQQVIYPLIYFLVLPIYLPPILIYVPS